MFEKLWPVHHLELRFSGPEALLGLVVKPGHLGWVATAVRVRSRMPGMVPEAATSPGFGHEA